MARSATLRWRLLAWLLPASLALSFIWLWGTYSIVIHFANLAYDRSLEDTAETIAGQVQSRNGGFVVDFPSAAQRMVQFDRVDLIYYLLLDQTGRRYGGNMDLPGPRGEPRNGHGNIFYDALVQGRPVRIVQRVVGGPDGRQLAIRVAETRQKRQILAREVMTYLIAPQLLFLASVILLIWVGVGRGVAPLARVRDAIARLDPRKLRQIEEKALPAELEEQVGVINRLIERLADAMTAQQRFIADASHQLRTPVANIRTQVELALRSDSHDQMRARLGKIDHASHRLVRLTGQLLTLSRLETTEASPERFETFPIEEALLEAVAGSVPGALRKGVEIGVDGAAGATLFHGDRHAIEQLVANLVDNAILYIPEGGRVRVGLSVQADCIRLMVEDNGPGIAEEDREHVLERFNRGTQPTEKGTGLGLSIVKEVIRLHRGRLRLQSAAPTGLCAEVLLPRDFRLGAAPDAQDLVLVG
ncbi:MAG: sensor histidine kinase [Candidatus Sphingomonas phytovorans]|nr:sensor histidine kinase [Sphingomonas sp.]WEJ99143.1 MAG: sensor histidine kinase [Sphingomonas sp.]